MKKIRKPLSVLLAFSMLTTTLLFANVFTMAGAALMYDVPAPSSIPTDKAYAWNYADKETNYCEYTYPTEVYINVGESLADLGYSWNVKAYYAHTTLVWGWIRMLTSMAAFGGLSSRGICEDQSFLQHFSTGSDESKAVISTLSNKDSLNGDYMLGSEMQAPGTGSRRELSFDTPVTLNAVATQKGDFTWSVGSAGTTTFFWGQYANSSGAAWKTNTDVKYTYDAISSNTVKPITIQYHVYDKSELQAELRRANGYDAPRLYTAASWNAFIEKKDAAAHVMSTREVTSVQVDTAAEQLAAARNALENVADYEIVNQAIRNAPQDLTNYTPETAQAVTAAIESVDYGCGVSRQSEVNAMAEAINAAVAALVMKGANYEKLDYWIGVYESLNRENYVDTRKADAEYSLAKTTDRNITITGQSAVDRVAEQLRASIEALVLKDADYAGLDEQIAAYDALDLSIYKDTAAVTAAYNAAKAVDRNLPITKQGIVDVATNTLRNAIAALEKKGADYAAVDAAIQQANSLIASNYKDFSGVTAAVNAVERGKGSTQQAEVDAMAAAILNAINALVLKDADYTGLDRQIKTYEGLILDNYRDTAAVTAAYEAAKAVDRKLLITDQATVDAAEDALRDAIAALILKDVDYTILDEQIAAYEALVLANYTDTTAVTAAYNTAKSLNRELPAMQQSTVNAAANTLRDMIAALVLKGADYTAVDAAIQQANGLTADNYKDFSAVTAALNAIERGKNITQQAEVDAMAKAIVDAINGLMLKNADYTALDAQIAAYEALDLHAYTDTTAVTAAYDAAKAVDRDLPITAQGTVDAAARTLETAIAGLISQTANYTALDEQIAAYEALVLANYTDTTAAAAAYNAAKAVDRNLPIAAQGTVDAAANALRNAIAALVLKSANYDAVDAAIQQANGLTADNYKDFSGVTAAVNAVERGKNITQQAEVDTMAQAIVDAISALVLKNADYTALDAQIAAYEALVLGNYTNTTAVTAAYDAAKAVGKDLPITAQGTVDAAANALRNAIAALVLKGANYDAVDAAVNAANALNADNYVDFSAVTAALNAIERGKNITQQAEVDAMAQAIVDAISALTLKNADYTALDVQIDAYEALVLANYTDTAAVTAAYDAAKAVARDLPITAQGTVDAAANALRNAIAALVLKGADYTAVNAAVNAANALNADNYVDFSAVTAALNAVVSGKNITQQAEVDAMAKAINDAVSALVVKIKITVNYDENGKVLINDTEAASGSVNGYAPGVKIVLTAVPNEGYEFVRWENAGGRVIGTTPSISTTTTISTSYKAVFAKTADTELYTVTFYGLKGYVIDTQRVAPGENAVEPSMDKIPAYAGYTFNGWLGDFTSVTSDVNIIADYAVTLAGFRVTADDGILVTGFPNEDGTYGYNTRVVASIESGDYSTFGGWSIDGGKTVISYEQNYVFYVGGEVHLTCVKKGVKDPVVPKPVVAITDVSVKAADAGKSYIAVLTERNIPSDSDYKLVQAGLIYTLTDKDLTIDSANLNSDVYVKTTTSMSADGQYRLTVKVFNGATLSFRGFAVYENSDGQMIVVYSDSSSRTASA